MLTHSCIKYFVSFKGTTCTNGTDFAFLYLCTALVQLCKHRTERLSPGVWNIAIYSFLYSFIRGLAVFSIQKLKMRKLQPASSVGDRGGNNQGQYINTRLWRCKDQERDRRREAATWPLGYQENFSQGVLSVTLGQQYLSLFWGLGSPQYPSCNEGLWAGTGTTYLLNPPASTHICIRNSRGPQSRSICR